MQQFWYVCSLSFEYLENCPMGNIYTANKMCFIFLYNFCSKECLPGQIYEYMYWASYTWDAVRNAYISIQSDFNQDWWYEVTNFSKIPQSKTSWKSQLFCNCDMQTDMVKLTVIFWQLYILHMTKPDCIYEVTVYDTDTKETAYVHTIKWNAHWRIKNNVRNKMLQTVACAISFTLK